MNICINLTKNKFRRTTSKRFYYKKGKLHTFPYGSFLSRKKLLQITEKLHISLFPLRGGWTQLIMNFTPYVSCGIMHSLGTIIVYYFIKKSQESILDVKRLNLSGYNNPIYLLSNSNNIIIFIYRNRLCIKFQYSFAPFLYLPIMGHLLLDNFRRSFKLENIARIIIQIF